MSNVVEMRRFLNREVLETLQAMLDLAEGNELDGLCFVAKIGNTHKAGVIGAYKRNASDALQATFKLERFLQGPLPPLPDESIG